MRFPLAVRYSDYDTKGHVNNAVFLTYFEMARAKAWIEALAGDADFPFILAEASIQYRSQARIGDPLEIEITTTEIRTKAWVWSYVVRDARDKRVIAEGRTVQVAYDYEGHRTIPIPPDIAAKLPTL
jgi:acyl-CoA thioester hydrolase